MAQDRFLIAVFDEWEAVGRVLADLGPEKIGRAGALLHIRKDEPPTLTASWLVQDMAELRFAGFRESMRCTAGRLAEALAKRSAGGVDDLAGALRGWMSSEQAREVQWHVEKGRIVLWLEPPTSEDVDSACARLVQQVRIWSNFAMSITTHSERYLSPPIDRTVGDDVCR